MKALKLKVYQNMCNYRKENSFRYVETYPLPTPSMIRGMIHSVLGLKEYKPLLISIQGESQGIITNLQRVYKFDRDPKSRPEKPYRVIIGESEKTADHGIIFLDLHLNINLIIHIAFEHENESLLEELLKKLQSDIVIIGRNEDFALIEHIKIVDVEESQDVTYTKYNMYVKEENINKSTSQFIRYRLPFWYYEVSSPKDNRVFSFVDVYYVGKETEVMNIMYDSEGDIVCFIHGNKE